jgi:anaerobic magnesium-protoporphyrin IX monomethyl ester cyclase
MTDCLLSGLNDSSFPGYVEMVRSMGESSGAYRDLNLAFIDFEGQPRTSMQMLNHFHFQGKGEDRGPFHNCDFLWPTITYLGTFLARRGYSFDYVNTFQLEKDLLREKLLHDEILAIGITTTLYVSVHPILEIISFIRQYNETAKIIIGGPYISNQSKLVDTAELLRLFKFLGADFYVISQEGEQTLANLLAALKNGGSFDAIDNLSYRSGDAFVMNRLSTENNPLEENMIDYSLFPQRDIGEFVSIRTAKSCPFACSFCGFPQRAGDYRYLDVELVEKELDALADLGSVTTLTFLDDTFNVPKKRFKEILRMMIRKDYGFKWNGFYRSDHGDEETIELMGEAGCEGVFLGVESGSDAMLKTMNKTARTADYLKAIPLLQSTGISAHANVIVGFPSETYETYQETIGLLEEARPDFYRAQLWYADPVTPIWNRREEFGVKGSAFNWSHNTMDYRTACDWVDRMFLCIENSVWLPQNGFEQWSTFYLQRKGMTLPQIKGFLKDFNALVKEKLLSPAKQAPTPLLVESLRRSCQFDIAPDIAVEPARLYSGAEYMAAETFWFEQFRGGAATSGLQMLRLEAAGDLDRWSTVPFTLEPVLVDRLRSRFQTGIEEVLLAAYGLLLSRIGGQEDVALVVAFDMGPSLQGFPLRLRSSWEADFQEWLTQGVAAAREAAKHAAYGLHLATNLWRMAQGRCEVPALEAGFLFSAPGGCWRGARLSDVLADWPDAARGLCLGLEVSMEGDAVAARFSHRAGQLGQQTVEELAGCFATILEKIAEAPQTAVGAIALAPEAGAPGATADGDAGELFDF